MSNMQKSQLTKLSDALPTIAEKATEGTFEFYARRGELMAKIAKQRCHDVEEDDEHLENISLSLKQRGGRLFASDEEEEDSAPC